MDALAIKTSSDDLIEIPTARIGLIIPSVNRLSEPQFTHFAPPGLGRPARHLRGRPAHRGRRRRQAPDLRRHQVRSHPGQPVRRRRDG